MPDNMADMGARLGEHAQAIKDDAADTASNMASKAKDYASQYAQQAKEYAQQGYDMAADKTKELKDTTQSYIEENPWYAIGIALGVGVLVGLLLRGGRD
jgi:ElaB/YqjD/DUF883 family membrane-anchored ribosome-binding protein